jgi:protein-L-isoaspartate(D-aspartate) O-methyltransferase
VTLPLHHIQLPPQAAKLPSSFGTLEIYDLFVHSFKGMFSRTCAAVFDICPRISRDAGAPPLADKLTKTGRASGCGPLFEAFVCEAAAEPSPWGVRQSLNRFSCDHQIRYRDKARPVSRGAKATLQEMTFPFQRDSPEMKRERMVRSQLAERGIRDPRVLAAMGSVPRHEFMPESVRPDAYEDHPLPIGEGQTISQPYIVAAMLDHLSLQASDRVLEVGTGSGYVTALLLKLCSEVFSVERYASLAASAEGSLLRLGCRNVKIKVGDGTLGWSEHAPFDAILVSAATAEIPPALVEQLKEGGRLIIPVGSPTSQALWLIRKLGDQPEIRVLEGCRFVPLVGGEARREL